MNKGRFHIALTGLILGLLVSCQSPEHASSAPKNDSDALRGPDSSAMASEPIATVNLDSSNSSTGATAPASLPFGPPLEPATTLCDADERFFSDLIGQNLADQPLYTTSFPLPGIDSVHYVVIDSNIRHRPCLDGRSIGAHLRFASYKQRLPDLGAYEMYYVSDATRNESYTDADPALCPDFTFEFYGFLLQVDRPRRSAQAYLLHSSAYVDALVFRTFHIGTDYSIQLCEKLFTSDEEGQAERSINWTAQLHLRPDGSFDLQKSNS